MLRIPWFAGAVLVAGLVAAAPGGDAPNPLPIKLVTHKVGRAKLQPLIVERGAMESADSGDVVCQVKSRNQASLTAASIKRVLVEDGAAVKKGQLLIELDSSGLEDALQTAQIPRDRAELDCAQAKENLAVVQSQNESDLAIARSTVRLAEINLDKFLKGDLEEQRRGMKVMLLHAQADVEQGKEALEQAKSKLKQAEATEGQVRVARLRLEAARAELEKAQLSLQTLEKYSGPQMETDLRGTLAAARQGLERAQRQVKAKEALARQELDAKQAIYQHEVARYKEIEEEIKKCKITAPRDGMVMYYVPEQTRWGVARPSIVAAGEAVAEGQKLMSIPDLGKMRVVLRVPEALVTQVRPGLPATVRVDAFPGRALGGRVEQVAATPVTRDWLTPDEKAYPTVIALDGDATGLRPGMSATVLVPLGRALDNVLTVPARAVLGRAGPGKTASCLVLTADGPEEREVVLGMRDEESTEVTSGLREGDEVIVNPQLLLNDVRDRIRFLRGGRPQPRRGE
jgi:RND family efflux transporter MFP subunit